jgi:4-diphosphocytidyl-2-C-methyl-D-erythritol kinase
MILFPNAKINIGLNVLRRRADGYHDIETIMIPTKWTDVLEIVPAKGDSTTLTISGRAVECPIEKNLVMKAYRALCEVTPVPAADIYLQKIIPDGAGLGGGSADAAFTLIGLNQVFKLGLSDETLAQVASKIGADCPFFIYNRPMLCTGIGTILNDIQIDLKGYKLVIAKPQAASVSTAEAYAGITPDDNTTPLPDLIKQPIKQWQGSIKNDFEKSIFALRPNIAELKQRIIAAGADYAAMSGSGASVFGIFSSDNMAVACKDTLTDCDSFIMDLD